MEASSTVQGLVAARAATAIADGVLPAFGEAGAPEVPTSVPSSAFQAVGEEREVVLLATVEARSGGAGLAAARLLPIVVARLATSGEAACQAATLQGPVATDAEGLVVLEQPS